MRDPHCHSSSILVERPADAAFEIMSDGVKQGAWAWGSANRREVEPGLFLGASVFTGAASYVRLNIDRERLLVDYDVGARKEEMQFRNMARVIPGDVLDLGANKCVVSLMTWRTSAQTDADWERLSCIHEAEMFLIKGLLERK
ncbi:MAG: hypothetical protein BGP06_04660 [Rhizobiales bacterium 65-9]|nr:hypothetical protein [Hyphomicrobiales bacterium]OJY39437.1 MAG: hypothetical protein BGP06_04660 [Rhizobiales bacterium 65-9]